jgi:hypothetical protein
VAYNVTESEKESASSSCLCGKEPLQPHPKEKTLLATFFWISEIPSTEDKL